MTRLLHTYPSSSTLGLLTLAFLHALRCIRHGRYSSSRPAPQMQLSLQAMMRQQIVLGAAAARPLYCSGCSCCSSGKLVSSKLRSP